MDPVGFHETSQMFPTQWTENERPRRCSLSVRGGWFSSPNSLLHARSAILKSQSADNEHLCGSRLTCMSNGCGRKTCYGDKFQQRFLQLVIFTQSVYLIESDQVLQRRLIQFSSWESLCSDKQAFKSLSILQSNRATTFFPVPMSLNTGKNDRKGQFSPES